MPSPSNIDKFIEKRRKQYKICGKETIQTLSRFANIIKVSDSLINVEKSDEKYTNQNNFYSLDFFANSILYEEMSVLKINRSISWLSFAFPVIKSHNDFV